MFVYSERIGNILCWAQLRKINVVSIGSRNLHKPLSCRPNIESGNTRNSSPGTHQAQQPTRGSDDDDDDSIFFGNQFSPSHHLRELCKV